MSSKNQGLIEIQQLCDKNKIELADKKLRRQLKNNKTCLLSTEYALVFYLGYNRGEDLLEKLLKKVDKIEAPSLGFLTRLYHYYWPNNNIKHKELNFILDKAQQYYPENLFTQILCFKLGINGNKTVIRANPDMDKKLLDFIDKYQHLWKQNEYCTLVKELRLPEYNYILEKLDTKYNFFSKVDLNTYLMYMNNVLIDRHLYYKMDQVLNDLIRNLHLYTAYQKFHIFRLYGLCISESRGHIKEAMAFYQKALSVDPNNAEAYKVKEIKITEANYICDFTQSSILSWSKKAWENKTMLDLLKKKLSFSFKYRKKQGKIRIGYISPNFTTHVIACFVQNFLSYHDKDQFWCKGYFHNIKQWPCTEIQKEFEDIFDDWHEFYELNTESIAKEIYADKIDILVDLAGFTEGNCLEVLALKPAPIQVTYLGWPNTTGLDEVDYRLVDNFTDPVGQDEEGYSETLYRLPGSFIPYTFMKKRAVGVPKYIPSANKGEFRVACFNNIKKFNSTFLKLVSQMMKAIPNIKLCIKHNAMADFRNRQLLLNYFEKSNISQHQINPLPWDHSYEEHCKAYSNIDIAIDPMPYNGTTTTIEALWMGVPVITLKGTSHRSRVSYSMLANLGVEEYCVANTEEEYIALVIDWYKHPERVVEYRQMLRQRIMDSPEYDGKAFAQKIEQFYREAMEKRGLV